MCGSRKLTGHPLRQAVCKNVLGNPDWTQPSAFNPHVAQNLPIIEFNDLFRILVSYAV